METNNIASGVPAVHLVSIECPLPGCDPSEQTDEPRFEDMGIGMDWGIDAAQTLALASNRECWLVDPLTSEILFRVQASDIVIH